jgi:18S rRNA (guanine1575-N7)-methyltransferase
LNVEESSLVLDIGCGSGISGFYLTQENVNWVGLDISESML